MTIKTTVEYVGFRNTLHRREYLLRAHSGPETRDFTVGIALAAFAAGRVRLQDGPEICYLKLQREIAAAVEGPAAAGDYTVSDQELAGYREAHTPARRPSPSAAATAATRPPQPASPGHS